MITWESKLDYDYLTDKLKQSKEERLKFNKWENKLRILFVTYCCINPCLITVYNIYENTIQTIDFNEQDSTINFSANQYIDQMFNHGKSG